MNIRNELSTNECAVSARRRLLSNMTSLVILQGVNYVLPLVMIPYLVRILGPDRFGLVSFAQAFSQYFVVFADYGFNLSATRQIAIHRDCTKKVGEIFCAVMLTKFALLIIGFFLLFIIVVTVPKFKGDIYLFLCAYFVVLGSVLFPIWFFQGIEKMKYITIFNVAARIVMLIAIFAFVRNRDDYILAAAIQGCAGVLAGVMSLAAIKYIMPIKLEWPSVEGIKDVLRDGWHVFISTAAISLYTTSNTFILGLLASSTVVGYFSAAEKIIRAAQGLLNPVSQALYPYISGLAAQSKSAAISFVRRVLKWVAFISFSASAALFILAEPIVTVALGEQYLPSVTFIKWMAFLPFIIALSNIFGIQTMLPLGMQRQFSSILVGSGLLNLALIIPLAYYLGGEGASIAVLITELSVTCTMAVLLKRQGIHLFFVRENAAC